jgi:possible bacteriophage antirepressor|nr:MAG TPA: BRO family protein [Caudoviricetes sp.]
MKELKVIDEREVFEKNFRVYGDFENPLFLAKDVAEWIDYDKEKVGQMLNTVDIDEKITSPIYYSGQVRNMWFLTEDGLYEVLMLSRKPIAKKWKKKVKEILKEIRKTGYYGKKKKSLAEMFLEQAQINLEYEIKMNEMQSDIRRLENNQRRTITSKQLTVIAYANMKGIKANSYNSSSIGRKATKLCREKQLLVGSVVDSRYGLINTYPEEILDEVFFG